MFQNLGAKEKRDKKLSISRGDIHFEGEYLALCGILHDSNIKISSKSRQ